MRLLRYFSLAVENIAVRKLRSILTMLGVIIGVASVLTTLGIGRGASADIMQDIASEGLTLLIVESGTYSDQTWTSGQPLTMADVAALSDPSLHPDIGQAVPLYRQYINLVAGNNSRFREVLGATSAYAEMHGLELAQGRFLTADEIAQRTKSVVIGADVAQKLFAGVDAVGQSLRIEREPYTVVGVLTKRGWGRIGNVDGSAIIPLAVAQERLRPPFTAHRHRGDYTVSAIHVNAVSIDRIDAAARQIEQTLRLRRALTADEPNDFSIDNQAWLLETANSVTATLTAFLAGIGAISLLVGGIGIMNIMLVSVTERTREIGLRKAVGAHNRDILLQFLAEALMLTLVGGLIGIAISYGLAEVVATFSTPDFPLVVLIEPGSLAAAVSVSAACGLLFGLYPAIRATRLDPIEALRHE
ncbi:MAG: ABC transporter permease [Caldilineaceae bacterium]|nr:ABC transporter permease [Caldilineaceae bacterium]